VKRSRRSREASAGSRTRRASPKVAKPPRPKARPRIAGVRRRSDSQFPIVGIGASAGGLDAMTRLLRAFPRETRTALVLVQHLDPRHESMLADILSHETTMPVREVTDGMAARPRHLYVIPPNAALQLVDGSFRITRRRATPGRPPLPIDDFLVSLAEIRKSSAIGVILSGTASDGTLGLRAIKAEGGITFAQDESAQFTGMPRAAVAAGVADFVLPPEEIARELGRIANHPLLYLDTDTAQRPDEDTLRKIFGLVRGATGVDFSVYRQTTILRRLARRLAVNKIVDHAAYLKLLGENPAEIAALFDDFLISVTSFFRDRETFDLLRARVLPDLLRSRKPDQSVRVWVPGCATGEEAYSLAICLAELQEPSRPVDVQIFATDVSEKAIGHARQAVYSASALADLSPERRRRFFTRVDGHFHVAKAIRDSCVFARQNVATDPPFSHLDLVSCRNLLIYLEPGLQRRLFPLFHHILNPGGYLVLGSAESVAPFGDLFTPVDKRQRVFVKHKASGARPVPIAPSQFGEPTRFGLPTHREEPRQKPADMSAEIDRLLIGRYAPPAVVINSNLEIVQFRGRTGLVLEPPSGAANLNVLSMAREGLLADLRGAIHRAKTTGERVRREDLRVRTNGGFHSVNVEITPLKTDGGAGRLYLILFELASRGRPEPETPAAQKGRARADRATSSPHREVDRLTKELISTREHLQSVIEEQESTNEELKSANEEILSSNEELQSTNEELDTAKEELQSANEELSTLNEELQSRNALLARSNDDLLNLLNSIEIPIVMLNPDGQIRRFTPAAAKLLNLIPGDVGRPIQNIRPNLDVADIERLVLQADDTSAPRRLEVRDRNGRWHLMRVQSFRTPDNKRNGVVVLFVDIDAQKREELRAAAARDFAESILQTVPEAFLVLDEALEVRAANDSFYECFQTTPEETIGCSFFRLGGGHWEVPNLREQLGVAERREIEVARDFDRIGRRVILLRTRRAQLAEQGTHILISLDDVTQQREAEAQLLASENQYRSLFDSQTAGAMVLDASTGTILEVNRYLTEFLGLPAEQFLGKKPWELPFVGGAERLADQIGNRPAEGPPSDLVFTNRHGQAVLMEAMQRVFLPGGRTQITLTDVTYRRRLEGQLRQAQKMESIGRLAGGMAHDFNNILNIISAHSESLKRVSDRPKVADSARVIDLAVERGAGVVRQLLAFARRDDAAFRPTSINEVFREVLLIVRETFPKNVRIRRDLPAGLPPVVGDGNQLHQALLNLLVNARDAMPGGGEIRVATREVSQSEVRSRFANASAGSYVRIEVADSGEGMDERTQSRVFEPFFTTKEKGAGSGMGLAVVHGVVASHRGYVDVESEVGKGTRFRLYFPVLARLRKEPAPQAPRRVAAGSETVLFVEDERMLLQSVAELLEQEGYRIIGARTAEEALEIFLQRRHEISLVVTDVELPQMSGWEMFRKMRETDPDVRALLVSGYLDPPMRARLLEGGARGFLRKPYGLEEMMRAMREILDDGVKAPDAAAPPIEASATGPTAAGDGKAASAEASDRVPRKPPRRRKGPKPRSASG
jgi:two-component system CheB/CheR fusion protein